MPRTPVIAAARTTNLFYLGRAGEEVVGEEVVRAVLGEVVVSCLE